MLLLIIIIVFSYIYVLKICILGKHINGQNMLISCRKCTPVTLSARQSDAFSNNTVDKILLRTSCNVSINFKQITRLNPNTESEPIMLIILVYINIYKLFCLRNNTECCSIFFSLFLTFNHA